MRIRDALRVTMEDRDLSQQAVADLIDKTQPAVAKAQNRGEMGRDVAELLVVKVLGFESWIAWCDVEKLDPMPRALDDMEPRELAIHLVAEHREKTPAEVSAIANAGGEQLHEGVNTTLRWQTLIDKWVAKYEKEAAPQHDPAGGRQGKRPTID